MLFLFFFVKFTFNGHNLPVIILNANLWHHDTRVMSSIRAGASKLEIAVCL